MVKTPSFQYPSTLEQAIVVGEVPEGADYTMIDTIFDTSAQAKGEIS